MGSHRGRAGDSSRRVAESRYPTCGSNCCPCYLRKNEHVGNSLGIIRREEHLKLEVFRECPNGEKHCIYWFGHRVPAAMLRRIFSAGTETVSRQTRGRAAVGGAGEFSFYPAGRRTNRKLEGRANLVGRIVQRRRKGRAEPHLRPRFRANARLAQAGGVQLDLGHVEQRLVAEGRGREPGEPEKGNRPLP